MTTRKIHKNSTICGHCEHAKSLNGNWQCNNPFSSAYRQQVSYADHACEVYEPMGDRSKKPGIPRELLDKIQAFIDAEWIAPDVLGDAEYSAPKKQKACYSKPFPLADARSLEHDEYRSIVEETDAILDAAPSAQKTARGLEDIIGVLGQTFQEKLLATIDAKGLKDSEVYSRANIDRRLFSKIRSNKNYKPSKPTALAFAIALGLNLDETTDLLQRAGLALSPSSKADLIVKYCILNGIYDIYDVNAILYEYDQQLLGY